MCAFKSLYYFCERSKGQRYNLYIIESNEEKQRKERKKEGKNTLMDSLCLNTGIGIHHHGTISATGELRTTPSQVSAKPQQKTAPFMRFPFTYPLKSLSLWPGNKNRGGDGGGGGGRHNGLALDDAVLVDNNKKTNSVVVSDEMVVEQEEEEEEEEEMDFYEREESENWVLKILHVRSLWKERAEAGLVLEVEKEEKVEQEGVAIGEEEEEEEDCELCSVADHDDEKQVDFDRDSFSRLLRRVSLAEAKLYDRMSYLGNLAYSIPKIKVQTLPTSVSLI